MKSGKSIAILLAVCCSSAGCAFYCPIRRPQYSYFTLANPAPIQLPQQIPADSPSVQHEQVTVAVQFFDAKQTLNAFHADTHYRGIQPILISIQNDSEQAYQFAKAMVDPHYFPAAGVARFAQTSRLVLAVQYVRWVTWLLPGFLFDTVIEPLSTIEFPGIREAVQQPAPSHNASTRAAFRSHEIADGAIAPHSSREGVMFMHPSQPDGVLPISLVAASTGQPVVFNIPTPPPPRYLVTDEYSQPADTVWAAAVKTAASLPWRVKSADQNHGVLVAESGMKFWRWSTVTDTTITIQAVNPQTTQVTVEGPLHPMRIPGEEVHSRSIDRFVEALKERLNPALGGRSTPGQPASSASPKYQKRRQETTTPTGF